jgi:nicotinic acid phosphoribosyltransferase
LSRFGQGGGTIRIGEKQPVEFKLYGGSGHDLNALYGGDSMKSATAFDEAYPKGPFMIHVDYEGRERDVCAEAIGQFAYELKAVYLDTPPGRIVQGGHGQPARALEMRILSQASDRAAAAEALEKFGFGDGLTIEATYIIRDVLDSLGGKSVQIIAAGQFDAEKIKAFRMCHAPVDAFTTGGNWLRFADVCSSLTDVEEEGEWQSVPRAGGTEAIERPEDMPVLCEKADI